MQRTKAKAFLPVLVLFLLLVLCSCTPDIRYADRKVIELAVDGAVTSGYIAGDDLDISAAVLYVTYDDDEIESIELEKSMLDPSSYDMTVPGKHTVIVKYGGCTTSFDIVIQPWELDTVELASEPYVTDYVVGERINLDGATIRMTFKQSRNSSEKKESVITVTNDMLEEYDNLTLGEKTIYLNYSDRRMSFNVNYTQKTATSLKIVNPATDNYVFIGLGQYLFYLKTKNDEPLNQYGNVVEKAQTCFYESYDEAYLAKSTFEIQNKESYEIGFSNRYDFSGMTVRIGFDNGQTPLYDTITGEALEKNNDGAPIYEDIKDISDCLTVSIDDDVEKTVVAVLMYRPKDYPDKFIYNFYGTSYVDVGSYVSPDKIISSNAVDRNGELVRLASIKSKSYGIVESVQMDSSGRGVIVVSTVIDYTLTDIYVKEGDIIEDGKALGTLGKTTIYSVGGGIISKIKNGVVTVSTAPTTTFTSKVQEKAFKSMTLVNARSITPMIPDTTLDSMIQGDLIDLTSGVTYITNPDGSITEQGPVRVDFTDGSYEFYKLNSPLITIVNAGAESTNEGLDISSAGTHVLWVVYAGEITHYTTLSVTVNSRYPVDMTIVSTNNVIDGNTYYFGDVISIANMSYYITYDNGSTGEPRQLTEDMLAEGCSLECLSDVGAYTKEIGFRLLEEDLATIPEGANRNIGSNTVFHCTVLPPSLDSSEIEVLAPAKKVYVTNADAIDLSGASYVLKYRNNVSKTLTGNEIMKSRMEGTTLSIGGAISIEINGAELETECGVYLDSNYAIHVDDGTTVIDTERYTYIGVRKAARLVYTDKFYSNYESDIRSENGPKFYSPDEIYSASVVFYYYLITNADWSVTSISVVLTSSGGIKAYKDTYAQYEYWDMGGIYITLSISDPSGNGTSSSTIPASSEMIYDSTTNRIGENIPVKFYFLGASVDNALTISVGQRTETSLELVTTGKDTYTQSDGDMNFSAYTFNMHYNAGPIDVINNLTKVEFGRRNNLSSLIDSDNDTFSYWWYELYQQIYVIYDEDNNIVNENAEQSTMDISSYTDYSDAVAGLERLSEKFSSRRFRIEAARGQQLKNGLHTGRGEVIVILHHTVYRSDPTQTSRLSEVSDVTATWTVNMLDSNTVKGVSYIGTNAEYIDTGRYVKSKHEAGYGSGSDYAIINNFGTAIVVSAQGEEVGTVNSYGVITPNSGIQIYFSSQDEVAAATNKLLTYSTQYNTLLGKYYITNANNAGVNAAGVVGNIQYYDAESSAKSALNELRNSISGAYFYSFDVTTDKYVIKNSSGKIATSTGVILYTFYSTLNDAKERAYLLNGIKAVNENSNDTYYYIGRVVGNKEEFMLTTGKFGDVEASKRLFVTKEDASEYLASLNLLKYTVSNELYVIAEIASGWEVMLSEYINNELVQKKLTVYYEDGSIGEVPITANMISYNRLEKTPGYRKITISYKNYSCETFIYVWNASLTGVEISQTPLTNYIRDTESLDLSEGVLKLTFTKYNQRGQEAGFMTKYISMEDDDVNCTGFDSSLCSKQGFKETITVQYKDYEDLKTSYSITVYDLQDVSFKFNNTIFFYGNVKKAGFSAEKVIDEFDLPKWGDGGEDIQMKYIEKKDLITYKDFYAMNLSDEERNLNYMPITVYDERGELADLYFIATVKIKSISYLDGEERLPYYEPASGYYYAVYSVYVKKDKNGNIVERYSEMEYDALTEEEKAQAEADEYYYERVFNSGDILHTYTESEYAALTSSTLRSLCKRETNSYYLLMTVKGNKYYETRNYCLQEYAIIPKVAEVTVTASNPNAFVLRVTTGNTAEAVLYLLNPSNLLPFTNAMKTDFSFINNVSLSSPNAGGAYNGYFEFVITLSNYDIGQRLEVLAGVEECFYRLLKALSDYGISSIRLGNDTYIANNINKSFNSNDASKAEMLTYISERMTEGVNVFTEILSDTEYTITYDIAYGETLKNATTGILELLDGQILLKNNGNMTFTAGAGTLSHPSYTVDINETITILFNAPDSDYKVNRSISAVQYNEDNLVIRLYMKNTEEVYSRWYRSGEFEAIRREIKSELSFLTEITVISPNVDYFELMFTVNLDDTDRELWTGSVEQKGLLNNATERIIRNMFSFGATEIYLGGDAHLLRSDVVDSTGVFFFGESDEFVQHIYFTPKSQRSNVDIGALYSTILSDCNDRGIAYSPNLSIDTGKNNYILEFTVFEDWTGNSIEKEKLANSILLFINKLREEGTVTYKETVFNDDTTVADILELIDKIGIDSKFKLSLPVQFTGSLWTFVFSGMYQEICDNIYGTSGLYGLYVTNISIYTSSSIDTFTFAWNGTGNTAAINDNLEFILTDLLLLTKTIGNYIYYGTDICRITNINITLDEAVLDSALKSGVNSFAINDKSLYEVSYTVSETEESDLLHFNGIYTLLTGYLSVVSPAGAGEYNVGLGSIADEVLYNMTLTGNNKIKLR